MRKGLKCYVRSYHNFALLVIHVFSFCYMICRDVYEYMATRFRERGRSKGGKTETFSLQQLQTARDEYDEEATLFVFRLKSLKQGQSRSLLTQAARHHAAQVLLFFYFFLRYGCFYILVFMLTPILSVTPKQLCFFKKAVKSLETVEPHVKSVTEQQHIDYHFNGLEEEDGDEGDEGDEDDDGYDENDDGELSFDYGQIEQEQDVSTSRNSMEVTNLSNQEFMTFFSLCHVS